MVIAGLIVVTVALLVALAWKERTHYITEYLFFIRYSLLLGLLVAALPIGASAAPMLLRNLFVMNFIGIVIVSCLAFQLGWAVVHVGRLIWVTTPGRCKLPFRRTDRWRDVQEAPALLMTKRWFWLATAISLPIVGTSVWRVDPQASRWDAVIGAGLGFIAAAAVRYVAQVLALRRRARRKDAGFLEGAGRFAPGVVRSRFSNLNPYDDLPPSVVRLHEGALFLLLLTLLVYASLGFLCRPSGPLAEHMPALAYALVVLIGFAWMLGAISFMFDKSRVPGVGITVLVIVLLQSVFANEHYFPVIALKTPLPPAGDAIHARWNRHKGPMVAVAASGGGITASYWTAIVLGKLNDIPDFHNRVGLVSSVSGGGVAGMYYCDGFTEQGAPDQVYLDGVVRRSGESSLGAVGWGMAYPDLWRTFLVLRHARYDRGWALEQRWARTQKKPDLTLGQMAESVAAGWKPIQVFNATLQENGKRLMLAPVRLAPEENDPAPLRMRVDMTEFLREGDVEVATAARLSATFPYVTPQARPAPGPWVQEPALHCADGGYVDNSGMRTALEALGDYLADNRPERPRKIALIEIRAANSTDKIGNARVSAGRGGLINSIKAPLETLYNARVSNQVVRLKPDFDQAKAEWESKHGVRAERFVFHLTDQLPLSWHLTPDERQFIAAHWWSNPMPDQPLDPEKRADLDEARDNNKREHARLRDFLTDSGAGQAAPADPAQSKAEREKE